MIIVIFNPNMGGFIILTAFIILEILRECDVKFLMDD